MVELSICLWENILGNVRIIYHLFRRRSLFWDCQFMNQNFVRQMSTVLKVRTFRPFYFGQESRAHQFSWNSCKSNLLFTFGAIMG